MANKQKDPKDRKDIWEHDSSHPFPQPEPPEQFDGYPHEIPRHVHGKGSLASGGNSKIVNSVAECEHALNVEGYRLLPW